MKRNLLLTIMIALLFTSCYPYEEFELGEAIPFEYLETKINSEENLRIRFDGVVADERCPVEYNCILAGNAKIQFTFRKGLRKETVVLNTSDDPVVQIAFGYQIHVFDLSPPNSEDAPPSRRDYVPTITVYPPHPKGRCDSNSDCEPGEYCDDCGTSSCPMCDDCVPACRPL